MQPETQSKLLALLGLVATVNAQGACTLNAETKPSLTWETCTAAGSCTTNNGLLVIDSNWRWTHALDSDVNCYTGNTWNATLCPSETACSANCCLDGAGSYSATYGVTTSGNAATLDFVTVGQYATNVGSRLYLMASDTKYEMFDLLGKEFTFDVNVANLPCGLNGALYFSIMDADGGLAKYSANKAGAEYGTGYCDSQCARDLKYINGYGNVQGWVPSTNDPNAGVGDLGSCCVEMDIWEANSISTAYTAHPCETVTQHMCNTTNCGGTYSANRYAGDCDPDGCDFNAYRNGDKTFYGPGSSFAVNTESVFTIVTQFITGSSGTLESINRFYVQNDVLIPNAASTVSGVTGNNLNPTYCPAEHAAFGETDYFTERGGFTAMASGFADGAVLVMSLWDDHYANNLWLDSIYPVADSASTPGAARGSCAITSGVPAEVQAASPNANVIYSNVKFGPINSTYTYTSVYGGSGGTGGTTTTSTTGTTTTSSSGGTQTLYGQCGGIGYTGPTACASPATCQYNNAYYSQCLG
jgi:cellulose 1,4-beta-cellobiosidase